MTTASVPKFERDLTTEYTKSLKEIQSGQNDSIWEEKLEILLEKKPTIFSYLCAFHDYKFIKKILSFANEESKTKGFQIAVGVGNVKLLDLLKDFKPTTEIMKNYLHFAMIQNKGSVINFVKKPLVREIPLVLTFSVTVKITTRKINVAEKLIELDPKLDPSLPETDNLNYRRARLLNQLNVLNQSNASNEFYEKYDTDQSWVRKTKRSIEDGTKMVKLNGENIAIYPIDETNPKLCNEIELIVKKLQPENIFLPLRSGQNTFSIFIKRSLMVVLDVS